MPTTPTPLTPDLRDLLRITRTQVAGLSQRQAALAAGGMSEVWWRTIETGRAGTAPADTVARMAYALDITPEQLRNIGQDHIADLVERRRALLTPEIREPPNDEAEQHLWETPGVSDDIRAALVAYLRTLRNMRTA